MRHLVFMFATLGLLVQAHAAAPKAIRASKTAGVQPGKALPAEQLSRLVKLFPDATIFSRTVKVFDKARDGSIPINVQTTETHGGVRMDLHNTVLLGQDGQMRIDANSRSTQINQKQMWHRFDNDPQFRQNFRDNTALSTAYRFSIGEF